MFLIKKEGVMKKYYYIIVVIIVSLNAVFAQRVAMHTLDNFDVNTSTNKLSFDIYSQSTGASNLSVGLTSYYIDFNSAALNTPVLSNVNSKYTTGSQTGDYDAMTVGISLGKIAVSIIYTGDQGPGDILSAAGPSGELMCTVTLDITNINANAEISWDITNSAMQASTLQPVTNNYQGSFDNSLPVELYSFTASFNQYAVDLKWQTKTEVDNYGFEIERRTGNKEEKENEWEKIGFVEGYGNSNAPKDYLFTDKSPAGGKQFAYRLKKIDNDGQYSYSSVVEILIAPSDFALYQNYPNPFNPTTTIKYSLPQESVVSIKVFDVLGSEVETLVSEKQETGIYEIEFNASSFASGMYIYRMQAGSFIQIKKMMILK
jgi:Secretion system C-terminal sorting domain